MHSKSFRHFGRRPEPDRLALLANCQKNIRLFEKSVPQYGFSVADLYHSERNHQGLANQLISPEPGILANTGEVQRRQNLGGMLNYYYRAAA
jgi:hypothetical protein